MANAQGGGEQQQLYGMEKVIDYIHNTEELYYERKQVKDVEERDILSFSELILGVARQVLRLAIYGIVNPYGGRFTDPEDGVKLYEAIKKGFLEKIRHLLDLLINDVQNKRNPGTGRPTPTVTRPSQTLDQPSTLTCPSCNGSINASIEVIVTDGKSPSIKVSVNAEGQELETGITCPLCGDKFKTKLQIGASSVGNSLSVRVSLENESATEKERLTMTLAQTIHYAVVTMQNEVESQGILDSDTFDLVNNCLQVSQFIILTLDDESFRTASWYEADEQNLNMMARLQSYVKHKLKTFNDPSIPLNSP